MFNSNFFKKEARGTTDLVGEFVATWSARVRRQNGGKAVFALDGAALTDADLGDAAFLLPLVVWHADNQYKFSINRNGLGAAFHKDDNALLKRSVNLDQAHRSMSELLCFTAEALQDTLFLPKSQLVSGAVELRSLVNQFTHEFGVTAASTPVATPAATAKPVA